MLLSLSQVSEGHFVCSLQATYLYVARSTDVGVLVVGDPFGYGIISLQLSCSLQSSFPHVKRNDAYRPGATRKTKGN